MLSDNGLLTSLLRDQIDNYNLGVGVNRRFCDNNESAQNRTQAKARDTQMRARNLWDRVLDKPPAFVPDLTAEQALDANGSLPYVLDPKARYDRRPR